MIRMIRRLALVALMLIAPLSANAAGITVVGVSSTGASTSALQLGDVLTIDLVADNATGEAINGLGLDVTGYDTDGNGLADNGVALAGGQVTNMLFTQATDGVTNFGGVENIWTAPQEKGNPADPFAGIEAVPLHAVIIEGAMLNPTSADNALDFGVDGGRIGDGGQVHFRVQFQAVFGIVNLQDVTLDIGVRPEFGNIVVGPGGASVPFTNDQVYFTVVPEPGTAMLFGLGLAGLATIRRR